MGLRMNELEDENCDGEIFMLILILLSKMDTEIDGDAPATVAQSLLFGTQVGKFPPDMAIQLT